MDTLLRGFFYTFVLFLLCQCSAAPRHQLTVDEKIADLHWIFSQFQQNYAPLQYKEQKYGFKFADLKARYLQEAAKTTNNEQFYRLVHNFVSEFHDAHTVSVLNSAALPNRTRVSYLGFDGIRNADSLVVNKILPTIASSKTYPIKKGDLILKLDGVPLADIVKSQFRLYRDLGNEEATLTYHFPKIFNRNSMTHQFSAQENAVLTVKRGTKEVTIELPWVTRDLFTFAREQKEAAAALQASEAEKQEDEEAKKAAMQVGGIHSLAFFNTGLKYLTGEITAQPKIFARLSRKAVGFDYRHSFNFIDTAPSWSGKMLQSIIADGMQKSETPEEQMKREREIAASAIPLKSQGYPAYIWPEPILDKDKKQTGKVKQIGYVYLNTFSPDADEEVVLKEFKENLSVMAKFGVKDIIIDMIDNGGGSLLLGLKLAQALSPTKIVAPEMQFKVSETWLDEFEKKKLAKGSDVDQEIARRVFDALLKEQETGVQLSRKWGTETLMPFELQPDPDFPADLNIYLLVNEMCASMCDIFTGVLKDNKMATVIGAKTMGAGGNVVSHMESPNAHFILNQTESLILRRDGTYIENDGINPDVPMKVAETAKDKYTPVRAKAVELILSKTAP